MPSDGISSELKCSGFCADVPLRWRFFQVEMQWILYPQTANVANVSKHVFPELKCSDSVLMCPSDSARECSKYSKTVGNLKIHIKIHIGEKGYKCMH